MKKIEIGKKKWTHTPTNSDGEEDWSLSCNGGNYGFFEQSVIVDGQEVGVLFGTTAEFDYCEITGNFTRTVAVRVPDGKGEDIVFEMNIDNAPENWEMTQEEFISMFRFWGSQKQ